jgi:acyl-CoA reductase-like NAD-dependent aldehyde dehydrogenase
VIGSELVSHSEVPLIAFTGSTEVGQQLMEGAIPRIKKLHLELGGKDPAIVCADADLDKAVSAITWAGFLNAGQVCTSVERVYVERVVYTEFCDRLAAFSKKLVVGPGFEPETQVTPMISRAARAEVDRMVQEAAGDGAKVLAGGQTDPSREKGFYYLPTVVADCTHAMRLMVEETFGPVVGVMPFDDFDEAVALANDSDYALGASLFTHDARRVRRFYTEVPAGTAWVNDPLVDNIAGPFGGMKMSGIGRELGQPGMDSYMETKHVRLKINEPR